MSAARRLVLQFDGGGILGLIPATVLARLEADVAQRAGRPDFRLGEVADLVSGTSTGAIIAGMIAARVPASVIGEFYQTTGPNLFRSSKRSWWNRAFGSRYDRAPFMATIRDVLSKHAPQRDANLTLGALPAGPTFLATAFNLMSFRTHFVRSDDANVATFQLADVISWSGLSAAWYFGKIVVRPEAGYTWTWRSADPDAASAKRSGAVFQDGGQGTQNCTLDYCFTELFAKGWLDTGGANVVSFGTGNKTADHGFGDVCDDSKFIQVMKYALDNQARSESLALQLSTARYLTQSLGSKLTVVRLDAETALNYELDDLDHLDDYRAAAQRILASSAYAKAVDAVVATL